MQRHPTGDDDPEGWAGVEQLSDPRRGCGDVFEVVDDQQRTGTLQLLAEQRHQLGVTPVAQTERGTDRRQDLALVADRCELDEDRAARVRVRLAPGDFQRKSRLPDPAWTREREEPGSCQEALDTGDLRLPPDEPRPPIHLSSESTRATTPVRAVHDCDLSRHLSPVPMSSGRA